MFWVTTARTEAASSELGEGSVPVVRLRVRERVEPERVELPDPRRIAAEHVDVRDLGRAVLRPDALQPTGSPGSPTRC